MSFSLFDQEEVLRSAVAGEKREKAEEVAMKLYERKVPIEEIAEIVGYTTKDIDRWLYFNGYTKK